MDQITFGVKPWFTVAPLLANTDVLPDGHASVHGRILSALGRVLKKILSGEINNIDAVWSAIQVPFLKLAQRVLVELIG